MIKTDPSDHVLKIFEVCSLVVSKVSYFKAKNSDLVVGVNTIEELQLASQIAACTQNI